MQTTRLTRRRVLLGVAGVGSAGAVGGVGTTVLTDDRAAVDRSGPAAGGPVDEVTLAVAVLGRSIAATPSLLATSVPADGSDSGTVRLRVRDGEGGRPTLRFGRVPQPSAGDSGPGMGYVGELRVRVGLDGDPVRTGPFEAVFDGSATTAPGRLCPGVESRLTVGVEGPSEPPPAVTDAAVAGTVLVDLDGTGCPTEARRYFPL